MTAITCASHSWKLYQARGCVGVFFGMCARVVALDMQRLKAGKALFDADLPPVASALANFCALCGKQFHRSCFTVQKSAASTRVLLSEYTPTEQMDAVCFVRFIMEIVEPGGTADLNS
jgi:hypothetical protein